MAAVLSRTQTVLERDPLVDRTYRYVDPEINPDVVLREVYVDIQTFTDLGEPEVITVTIEPGDTLN